MSTVDSKVVEARFDNKGFSEGIKNTIRGLDDLSKSLASTAKNVSLDKLGAAADRVGQRFSIMRVAAVTAVATIASQATRAAERMVKSFTLDPIMAGFHNYETQINAVQTILANTGLEGSKGLGQVNGVLQELNDYANKTVYNFSEMTKNIGTFTAAGVKLKPAASAIKGIANLAALSGSSSEQASTAMYQLSQAIAANKVGLQDWNSVVNAGLGGKVFQRALFQTGATMHTIKGLKVGETFDQWTKAGNSFRGSLQKGWITGDVLTKTLAQFTGDMKDADLAAQGFSKTQIAAIQKQAKVAQGAATNIKTISQLKDALKEEVGTAYANIFKTLLGDINQATALLSGLHTAVENALTGPINHLNKLLQNWAKLGGRVRFIDAIKYAFKDLMTVVTPIQHAFRDIFPRTSSKQLYQLTNQIEKFFQYFKLGASSAKNLKETFRGVFAVFDIGITIIKQVAHFIGDLFGMITKGSKGGGLLAITAHVGTFLVALDAMIKNGTGLRNFFLGLEKLLSVPIKLFHEAAHAVSEFLSGSSIRTAQDLRAKIQPVLDKMHELNDFVSSFFDGKRHVNTQGILAQFGPYQHVAQEIRGRFIEAKDAISNFFSNFGKKGGPATEGVSKLGDAFSKIGDAFKKLDFSKLASSLANAAHAVGDVLKKVVVATLHGLSALFTNVDFSQLLSTVNTGLFAALVLLVKKFLGNVGKKGSNPAGGIFESLKGTFEGVTGTLEQMQKTLKATILLEIATAIGILAAACFTLAKINPQALSASLSAIGQLMAELFATLFGFSKIGGIAGIVTAATGMVIFAGAIEVLTNVVKKLAKMDVKQLNQGLGALAKLIGEVVLAAIAMGKYETVMIGGATGLLIMSGAIKVLVGVVKDLGKLDIKVLNQGLKAVGTLLVSLALFTKFAETDKMGVISSAGIVILAAAIKVLYTAVRDFGKLPIDQLRKGLISVGLVLAGFGALSKIEGNPATILASAASMTIMAFALKQMIKPIQALGKMSWNDLAKGLVGLGVAVGGIATALSLMPPTASINAAAIGIVALAVVQLANAMQTTGGMSWEGIAKSLVALGGALVIIGLAVAGMSASITGAAALYVIAKALSVLAPVLTTLGGLSWSQVAIGLVALGGALLVIGGAATLLTPVIPAIIGLGAGIALLGVGVAGIGAGVFLLATGLAALAAVGAGAAAAIVAIVGAVITLIPLFATKLVEGIGNFIDAMKVTMPKILSFVQQTLLQLIALVAKVVPPLVNTVIKLLGLILNQLSAHAPKFFAQMIGLLLALLNAVKAKAPAIVASVVEIALDIVKGLAYRVKDFVGAGANIIINILKGLKSALPQIVSAAVDTITAFIQSVAEQAQPLANAAFSALITFINGITDAVNKNLQPLIDAGAELAGAIVKGLLKGLADIPQKVAKAGWNLGKSVLNAAKHAVDSHSPSKEFIKLGHDIGDGFIIGIRDGSPGVKAAWEQASGLLKQAVTTSGDAIKQYQDDVAKTSDKYKKSGDQVAYYTQKIAESGGKHKVAASTLQKYKESLDAAKKAHAEAGKQLEDYKQKLDQAIKDHQLAKDAAKDLANDYKNQHTQMTALAKVYDDYLARLNKEKDTLASLKQTRDDYNKSVVDQYSTVQGDVTPDTTTQTFQTSLDEQLADLAKFSDVLQQLRAIGLDDTTYKMLLSKGTVALPFMEDLLKAGKSGVDKIDAADLLLQQQATALGAQTSANLYQAGIDAQQVVVDGLTSDLKSTQDKMNKLADKVTKGIKDALAGHDSSHRDAGQRIGAGIINGIKDMIPKTKEAANQLGTGMIKELKRVLGIHSPSKEGHIIGQFFGSGVVTGLVESVSNVSDAASNIGDTAKDALKKSISGLAASVIAVSDLNPTITPVLDLSDVKKSAGDLNNLLATQPVVVDQAYSKAMAASVGYQANLAAANAQKTPGENSDQTTPLVFNQYNQSPKALDAVEIYRQTSNQISVAKGALKK
jgi:tape measure domain-containing protein